MSKKKTRLPVAPWKQQQDVIWSQFDRDALAGICVMPERSFAQNFGMATVDIPERRGLLQQTCSAGYSDFYAFKDNGSSILAVAHLDTVVDPDGRTARFVDTDAGPVVFSGALDDRLGAYTILDLLPNLGINVDVLLTVGEENGMSTAEFFDQPKDYDWMIEFDRGGTDVVMYQYGDPDSYDLIAACGADVGHGSFSDIAYLEHLGVKGFNWGVGYRDYHGPRGHAFIQDYVKMLAQFVEFHSANKSVYMEHVEAPPVSSIFASLGREGLADDWPYKW